MPTSRHRKSHKQKKSQRRAELDLKRHRTQVFAKKIEEAVKSYKEQEEAREVSAQLPPVGYTPLEAKDIDLQNYNVV